MALSRRQFFDRFRQAAEGPQRWRDKRIAELREYAMAKAPPDWNAERRSSLARAVEDRLVYMSDDSLRGPGMRRYVDSVIESKTVYYNSEGNEEDYYREGDSYYNDYPR